MVAIGLLKGALTAEDYEDSVASDVRVDTLREKMEVVENTAFTHDYLDPGKRSIGNAVQIFFRDGSATEKLSVEYPIGHRRRRSEGVPVLLNKFENALRGRFAAPQADAILALCGNAEGLAATPVDQFMALFVAEEN